MSLKYVLILSNLLREDDELDNLVDETMEVEEEERSRKESSNSNSSTTSSDSNVSIHCLEKGTNSPLDSSKSFWRNNVINQ